MISILTEQGINNILNKIVNSSEGKKLIDNIKRKSFNGGGNGSGHSGNGGNGGSGIDGGFPSKVELMFIANDLKNMLYNEIVLSGITSFSIGDINVESPLETADGCYSIKLNFSDEALKRKSLWNGDSTHGGYTGNGLYDIIGLFVNGYVTDRSAYGFWVGHENNGRIKTPTYREPNDFISRAISMFEHKYAGKQVKVFYPSQWGGNR